MLTDRPMLLSRYVDHKQSINFAKSMVLNRWLCDGYLLTIGPGTRVPSDASIRRHDRHRRLAVSRGHRGGSSAWRILRLEFPPNDPSQWRDLKDASLDMLMATKRRGYSRARTRLEAMEERVVAIYNSTRWRITEPLAELYQLLRRPFRAN
jgi:hypothetical protein